MCRNVRIKIKDTMAKQVGTEISPAGTSGEIHGRIQNSFEFYQVIK
jgi:hypothetical protein